MAEATDGRLTDHLATVLAARYAAALAGWDGEVTEEFRRKMRALRGLCQDIVELRRGDHSGARLNMERERLDREKEKTEEEVLEHFKRWAANPQARDSLCRNWINPEERERRLRELFGLAPGPDEAATGGLDSTGETTTGQTESSQIKPNQMSLHHAWNSSVAGKSTGDGRMREWPREAWAKARRLVFF